MMTCIQAPKEFGQRCCLESILTQEHALVQVLLLSEASKSEVVKGPCFCQQLQVPEKREPQLWAVGCEESAALTCLLGSLDRCAERKATDMK